jgi:sterol desaturase/sphingolipid hydroxylase (fatty acid hydroxylase superfamily)
VDFVPDLPPDPTLYALPVFAVALILERLVLARRIASGASLIGYRDGKDTLASLAMGVGSVFFVTLLHLGVFSIASALYPHRLFTPAPALAWVLAIVGWDFLYYWHHRFEHEVRLLWAAHVNHHSSRAYNFSTALRQPWTPWIGLVLFPPLALLGVRPEQILLAEGINLIYQFWVHTEAVDRLPAFVEAIFNTPSHHRVHHGKNPRYLDKNYGGILIVWDRLFRTFEPEGERVVYGITKDLSSYNPFVIAFHEYAAIARDVRRAGSVREALGLVFGRPT